MTAALVAIGVAAVAAIAAMFRRRRPAQRRSRSTRSSLSEPWRRSVSAAQAAQRRYKEIVAATPAGPLRSNMESITRQVQRGVEECWFIAKRGDELDAALNRLDSVSLRTRLEQSSDDATRASLQAQLDSAERIRSTRDRHRPATAIAQHTSRRASGTGCRGQRWGRYHRRSRQRRRRRRDTTRIAALGARRGQQPAPRWRRAGIPIAVSSLLRSNVTVAAGTAVSRITGLARVAVLGIVLSQGPVTDAYDQANGTPNMIYELLLGGVLSATLVPLLTRLHDDDDDEATSAVISVGIIVLAAITAIAVVAAPLIFRMYSLLTSSEVDAGQYHAAGTLLARIFLVQIFFYGLNAIGSAVLNARRRFFAAAWAPALSNLAIIVSLLLVPSTVQHRVPQLSDVLDNAKLRWTLGLGATVGIAVMAFALVPALDPGQAALPVHPVIRPSGGEEPAIAVEVGTRLCGCKSSGDHRDPQPVAWRQRQRGRLHQGVHVVRAPPRSAGRVDRHDLPAGAIDSYQTP